MLKRIPENHMFTYLLFGIVAMAGLSYVNYLPSLVSALVESIGYSPSQGGTIVASNGYGALLGSLFAIFLVHKFNWRRPLLLALTLLVSIDSSTFLIQQYESLLWWRFFAGVCGGVSTGVAISALARLKKPDSAFGFLLFIQFIVGSLVIYLSPFMQQTFGNHAIFYAMAAISVLAIVILLFLPSINNENTQNASLIVSQSNTKLLSWMIMLAIFCYQGAASAIYGYLSLIGSEAKLGEQAISTAIATTGLLGLLGALLPVLLGKNYRGTFIGLGILLSIVSAFVMAFVAISLISFSVSAALLFLAWPAVLSSQLAITASLDSSGRLSTMANMMSMLGMATGPLIAATVLESGSFNTMLLVTILAFTLSLLFSVKLIFSKSIQQGSLANSPQTV